ncbi:MAG: glycine--tRNA ligase, partial [Planctomycetota bacterium]
MEKIVSLCKRRGFLFQSSEIYGGAQGLWDYGPLGVELKRNLKEAWWHDMIVGHNELVTPENAPGAFEMVGLDCTILMHPQVWKCSGHYDLFHDFMVDCKESKRRNRLDQVRGRWCNRGDQRIFVCTLADAESEFEEVKRRAMKFFKLRAKNADELSIEEDSLSLDQLGDTQQVLAPDAKTIGTLTEPREFNLMFKTTLGALGGENDVTFL